jgi:hypothetical protein
MPSSAVIRPGNFPAPKSFVIWATLDTRSVHSCPALNVNQCIVHNHEAAHDDLTPRARSSMPAKHRLTHHYPSTHAHGQRNLLLRVGTDTLPNTQLPTMQRLHFPRYTLPIRLQVHRRSSCLRMRDGMRLSWDLRS